MGTNTFCRQIVGKRDKRGQTMEEEEQEVK
jgi:hypothetical protein